MVSLGAVRYPAVEVVVRLRRFLTRHFTSGVAPLHQGRFLVIDMGNPHAPFMGICGKMSRSLLRTWLTGILKHKIIDLTRSRCCLRRLSR